MVPAARATSSSGMFGPKSSMWSPGARSPGSQSVTSNIVMSIVTRPTSGTRRPAANAKAPGPGAGRSGTPPPEAARG